MTYPATIREAELADISLILSLIYQKHTFDRQLNAQISPLEVTEQRLVNTLFCNVPYAYVSLAELDTQAIGFALYYFCYSSFAARPSIWLDDLFVNLDQRQQGVGSALINHLLNIAILHHCTHIGWFAHALNHPAIQFYRKLGAEVKEQHQHQLHFQLQIEH